MYVTLVSVASVCLCVLCVCVCTLYVLCVVIHNTQGYLCILSEEEIMVLDSGGTVYAADNIE